MDLELAGFDGGDVEQFVHHVEHALAGLVDGLYEVELICGEFPDDAVAEEFGEATDGGERVAQVVRGHAEELVFGGVGLAELIDEQGLLLHEQAVLQVGADARDRLLGADGFGEVIDTAGAQALDHIIGFAFGGDKNDWGGFFAIALAELAAGLESVDARHHDIEQHQLRAERIVHLQRFFARVGFGDRKAFLL